MECWICKDIGNVNSYCQCNNDLQYAHIKCITTWYCKYNHKICRFCKTKYKIPLCYYFFYQFIFFYSEISQYDLYNGVRWDETF